MSTNGSLLGFSKRNGCLDIGHLLKNSRVGQGVVPVTLNFSPTLALPSAELRQQGFYK
jgi:hypothetical protein